MLNNGAPAASQSNTQKEQFSACFQSLGPEVLGGDMTCVMEQIANDASLAIAGGRSAEAEALATFMPYLLCGEESAVHAFYRESRRQRKANVAAQQLFLRIAREEKVHELMLNRLVSELPQPKHLEAMRRMGHDFFVGLADPDPGVHFARVAALDSGVCKIMAVLCAAPKVSRVPAVFRVFNKVRADERTHVRISRQYVLDLGLSRDVLNQATDFVCPALADFLAPGGDVLETMGIDPDRLFRRIRREEV